MLKDESSVGEELHCIFAHRLSNRFLKLDIVR